ncbi:MAG: DUF2259 domain-containing protein [Hyphomicrobiales bacterium]|nr:DUF2259 domain-containing protein [Hyphomicrobiales bacterium]
MRNLIMAILFLLSASSNAFAGDSAERRIIGFSPDGKWFAFEQFGVQDGSGFPYYDIFIVDLDNDKWATGTPVRVRIDDEDATLHQARGKARVKAAPMLAKLRIIDQGRLIASNPVTEVAGDTSQITFQAHMNLSGLDYRYRIKLEQFDLPSEPLCKDLGTQTKGFAISISKADQPPTQAYRDTTLPKSRGCASRYAIADVIAANNPGRPNRFVVLVHTFAFGFEGPDARFIAIPVMAP